MPQAAANYSPRSVHMNRKLLPLRLAVLPPWLAAVAGWATGRRGGGFSGGLAVRHHARQREPRTSPERRTKLNLRTHCALPAPGRDLVADGDSLQEKERAEISCRLLSCQSRPLETANRGREPLFLTSNADEIKPAENAELDNAIGPPSPARGVCSDPPSQFMLQPP